MQQSPYTAPVESINIGTIYRESETRVTTECISSAIRGAQRTILALSSFLTVMIGWRLSFATALPWLPRYGMLASA